MPPKTSSQPPQALLARVVAEVRQRREPRMVALTQLRNLLHQWYPPRLWASVYDTPNRGSHDAHTTAGIYRRFSRNPPRVSRGWMTALQLMDLARLADRTDPLPVKPCSAIRQRPLRISSSASAPTTGSAVEEATEHLLRFGVFPSCGWALTLQLLTIWRGQHTPDRQRLFPSALSPPAAAQLLHHISLAPPSSGAWQDAMWLYQLCALPPPGPNPLRPPPRHATDAPSSELTSALPAPTAFLKALRHMTLVTLLQTGAWERGLHFYYHTLYQRDLPGAVTTSCLAQQLGRAGQWVAVLQVYELCVRLLEAQRNVHRAKQLPPSGWKRSLRDWGTTLSMLMEAAQTSPGAPNFLLASMVRLLQSKTTSAMPALEEGTAAVPCGPLVQLDGHFLAAVQALPSKSERLAVLRRAQQGDLLDTFKLIRGLVSKHQWEHALALFDAAMGTSSGLLPDKSRVLRSSDMLTAPPSPLTSTSRLSRKEIGEARLIFMRSASIDSIAAVVAALNRHRGTMAGRRTGTPNGAKAEIAPLKGPIASQQMRLLLNDQEVESVFAKTVGFSPTNASDVADEMLSRRACYWAYCLEVFAANYGSLPSARAMGTSSPSSAADSRAPLDETAISALSDPSGRRRPTVAALSFLFRHPKLPWHTALQILQSYRLFPNDPRKEAFVGSGTTVKPSRRYSSQPAAPPSSCSVTPHALLLSATVELLRLQGQSQPARDLALRVLEAEASAQPCSAPPYVSLSASLLQVLEYPMLRMLLLERSDRRFEVEARTLFHLLHEGMRVHSPDIDKVGEAPEDKSGDSVVGCRTDSGEAERFFSHPCGRALTVVWLLMQRRASADVSAAVQPPQTAPWRLPWDLFLVRKAVSLSQSGTTIPAATCSLGKAEVRSTWLTAYPVAIHVEVLRVIERITSPGQPSPEASVAGPANRSHTRRWRWTLRYLKSLRVHFDDLLQPILGHEDDGGTAALSLRAPLLTHEANDAFYGVTFEAVVSLLGTIPQGRCPSGGASASATRAVEVVGAQQSETRSDSTGIESEDEAIPQALHERVRLLCSLLEYAIICCHCLPPTHMLLPNQLDRLLPALPVRRTASPDLSSRPAQRRSGMRVDSGDAKGGVVCNVLRERCTVALHLVRYTVQGIERALRRESPDEIRGVQDRRRTLEPALLHNLLKLCCRISEYEGEFSSSDEAGTAIEGSGLELCFMGAKLLRWQCEHCGLETVRPGTLPLLYHLCAAAQARVTCRSSTTPRQVALDTTVYLLQKQASTRQANSSRGTLQMRGREEVCHTNRGSRSRPVRDSALLYTGDGPPRGSEQVLGSVVQPQHCRLFLSLLGWEDAVEVWYRAFPHTTLSHLSHDPQAVETCLRLGEHPPHDHGVG